MSIDKKNCYLVWLPRVGNDLNNYFGLGDIIRGTIAAQRMSEKYHFNLHIITKYHPIGKFLVNSNNIDVDLSKVKWYGWHYESEFVRDLEQATNHVLWFQTCGNLSVVTDSSKDQRLIERILQLNSETRLKYQEIVKQLPNNYQILHCRFKDDLIKINSGETITHLLEQVVKFYQLAANNDSSVPILVCCNVPEVKNNLPKYMLTIPGKPAHIGLSLDDDANLDTIFEFLIISKAVKISTYTAYGWRSGFVDWISRINEIPIVDLK